MTRNSLFAFVLLAAGCGDGAMIAGTGKVQVFVAAEATIPDGLQPGTGEEDIKDGWTVKYDRFLAVIGNFRAARSTSASDKLAEPKVYVLDMKRLPTNGFVLASFDKAAATRWDKVGFDLPNATAGALKSDETAAADQSFMIQKGYSLYFEAKLTKADGKSCKPTAPADCVPRTEVTVKWGLPAGTAFDDCAPSSGDAGFAVPTGGTIQVKPTIHGDHWFFSNVTQGAEITERLAQWIADCDLDRNGETTVDELKQVKASDVFPSPKYNLTGAIIPISTAYDYLEAQARTLGDYQGEGECPTRKKL